MGATLRPAMTLAVNTNALVANAGHLIATSMNFPMACNAQYGFG